MATNWTWEEMSREFVALGGAVDNVRHGRGPFGHGLFVVDPAKPVRVHVPARLLVARDQLVCEEGALVVHPNASIGSREKDFFRRYQASFSWGRAEADCRSFIEAIDALPNRIRDLLAAEFHLGPMLAGSVAQRTRDRFLDSRVMTTKAGQMFMPVVELLNHSPFGTRFDSSDGVTVGGVFEGEVLARYRAADAFAIFESWGFASREPAAFSLPLLLTHAGHAIGIRQATSQHVIRDREVSPEVVVSGKLISLSHLMLGHTRHPERPFRTFRRLMEEIGQTGARELFDAIRTTNVERFEGLQLALTGLDGSLAVVLRDMCRFQLEALASCDGE